jgi:hypothetical protein
MANYGNVDKAGISGCVVLLLKLAIVLLQILNLLRRLGQLAGNLHNLGLLLLKSIRTFAQCQAGEELAFIGRR